MYAASTRIVWFDRLASHGGPRELQIAAIRITSLRGEISMSTSTTAMTSSASVYTTRGFWERVWRTSGIQFVMFFIIAYVIYGNQPQVGASSESLVAFYQGDRARILIAAVFSGLNVLNLMRFAAALRTTLPAEGAEGWGAAGSPPTAELGRRF